VVTILFCDLVHSTELAEGDPETYRRVQLRFFDAMRKIVEEHGGTLEKFIGDEVMAVFGVPQVHEDDALRAVRAADAMVEAVSELGLHVRIGVNTGEVLVGDPSQGHGFLAGEAVVIAKRLQSVAEPDDILIGKATYPLVEHAVTAGPLERIPVKGKRAEVGKRRLERIDRDAPRVARRLDAPIVGRDDELQLLVDAFERAVEARSCRKFSVLGPPGIGKSRLATEFCARLADRATTATGRCLSYGAGITFWPLAEMLRELGGQDAVRGALTDNQRDGNVLALLGRLMDASEATPSNEEVFWVTRRAFEALARRRPLVLCFEDMHWAEPTLLDLIEYVAGLSHDAPMLLLCLARPELVEERPTWMAPQPDADAVALEPLSSVEAQALLEGLSGDLPTELRTRIESTAEGNPLFLEQMAAIAAEDGGELRVPPSIQALLAERLDRLARPERELLERASVVGRGFSLAAVAALSHEEQRSTLPGHLLALAREGLVHADPVEGDDRFRFHHALVRDEAYRAVPKELRATLHEQLARWMEDNASGSQPDELIGYHFEQAFRYREELGLVDAHTDRISLRACELLAAAGKSALVRNDVHAARKLLNRAVELRPDDPAVDVRLDLALALLNAGEFAVADELTADTESRAAAAGEKVGALRARLLRARIASHVESTETGGEGPSAELLAVAEEAIPVFAQNGDDLALAEAWVATAYAQLILCHWAAMLEALDQALEYARRAGSTRWDGELPTWKGTALFYGPAPVDDALYWYEEQELNHPVALTQQAMLEAMRGNFDRGRALASSANEAAEEFGQKLWLAVGGMALCEIETLAGDMTAAEYAVRRSCEVLEELGEVGYRYNAVSQLAASLYALDRLDEAEELTREAEVHAPTDDVASQILWRQVRALILARHGEGAAAERLAREAFALAVQTDMLNWQASALVHAAEVGILTGKDGDARQQLERACALYDEKGNLVAAARVRDRMEELQTGVSGP
jgi:class 3 adenylate cyclase/tetratricopeptide (TPR) repeat protein